MKKEYIGKDLLKSSEEVVPSDHAILNTLLVVAALLVIVCSCSFLGWLLLLLVLGLCLFGQRLLQNLEDFLIGDLLVRLELGQIRGRWCGDLLKTIFRDSLGKRLAYSDLRKVFPDFSTHQSWSAVFRPPPHPCHLQPHIV